MAMAAATEQLLPQEQRRRRQVWGLAVAALLLVMLLAAAGPLRPRLFRAPLPQERVALTLLSGAKEKGAVCVDGTPPGYHLQRGSGDGADRWLVHLEVPTVPSIHYAIIILRCFFHFHELGKSN